MRARLLGRASVAALLTGCAAMPQAMAGGSHLNLSQALAAGAAAARNSGNAASIAAGQQAATGIANLQAAAKRFTSLQQALSAQANASSSQGSAIPNGIATGGLQPENGYNQAGAGVWLGVNSTAPVTETSSHGTTTVTINQTSSAAVLNWQNFNVGSHTKLVFNQSAGGGAASSWTVLNRIDSNSPSLIFGDITAQGQVLVLNPSGVLFGDGAQVNLHSLVAGAITLSNQQFLSTGIYGVYGTSKNPSVAAGSSVLVEQGAAITTPAPANASDGGGSVILLAASVENDGTIQTPAGQTILGGGSLFTLRTGYSVPANSTVTPGDCPTESACSTVLGTEIDASGVGSVTNKGFIEAATGDITLAGETITQAGVLYSTNSVSRRGTIHLLSDTTDPDGSITLAPGSLTTIAPDPNSLTADISQRDDTPQQAYGNGSNLLADQVGLTDYPDRSRIEITTGGAVNFEDGSLTLANAGQVAVSAVAPVPAKKGEAATHGQIFVASGATIDVSGLNDVVLPMSANTVQVNVQGFQLRDAPVNRDSGALANLTITLDARQLIYVAPSTSYGQPRDYTAGGLIEVSGELSQAEHSIEEWSTVGGDVSLQSDAVVAQPGSTVNIAGGTIEYQAGAIPQTYLIGPGGTLYNANTAPANLQYTGAYDGFTVDHARWHVTDTFENPLLTPASILSPAYIEGRDAGTLTLIAPTAVFEATLNAGVQTGPLQTVSHATVAAGTDPVTINQDVAPLAGALVFADTPFPNSTAQALFPTDVAITPSAASSASTLSAGGTLAGSLIDTASFGANQLAGLGGLTIEVGSASAKGNTLGSIVITGPVTLAQGGTLTLAAPVITVDAPISARSGAVTIEAANPQPGALLGTLTAYSTTERGAITLGAGASIDTRGEWTNLVTDPSATSGAAFINGGNVSLISSGALTLAKGSSIDASAGAVFGASLKGGAGGNITLAADDPELIGFTNSKTQQVTDLAPVTLDGTLRSLGVTAGGTFSLAAPSILIGNNPVAASPLQVALPANFFSSGFSDYLLNGFASPAAKTAGPAGIVIAPGTSIEVVEPVLEASPSALISPTGTDPNLPLQETLFPEFALNPATQSFQRRAGASLTLSSEFSGPVAQAGSGIFVGQGASITVDTGQSVTLQSLSQITVDGAIHAPGGTISVLNTGSSGNVNPTAAAKISIWIGDTATLDVAGRAVTGVAANGGPIGEVFAGGSILVGASGNINNLTSFASADAYIFVRPGANLDASGAAASIDLQAGNAAAADGQITRVGSAGGTIAFASDFGIYLDGSMQAQAGAPDAAGGELAIRLGDPGYGVTTTSFPNWAFTPHQIVVSQTTSPTPLPENIAPGEAGFASVAGANGQAAISAQQISEGGFGTLLLLARDQITFNGNVSLAAAQSITLADDATSASGTAGSVSISAPYVLLAGAPQPSQGASLESPLLSFANANSGSNNGYAFSKKQPCIAGVAACYATTLTVRADLIDIEGDVRDNGAYADFYTGPAGSGKLVLDSNGFDSVSLISAGDIRFIPANYTSTHTSGANGLTLEDDSIETAGDLALDAARIYPATGVDATAAAGVNFWGGKDALQKKLAANVLYYGGTLTVGSTSKAAQSAPLSAFAELGLSAATIVQGGDVQAPLGTIAFGNLTGDFPAVKGFGITPLQVLSVTLAPGSMTSVSANGLTIPFGGTTDGTSFGYDGQSLTLPAASLGGIQSALPSIQVNAPLTTVSAGATLNISGGGTLVGGAGEFLESGGGTVSLVSQGFISGRGGSTDTLTTPFITFTAKTLTASTPSLAQEPVYAILPGFASAYAPVTSLEGSTTNANGTTTSYYGSLPQIGEQITLGAGVPGLAAGTYTLLPSYYALLPGAYRVQLGTASVVAGSAPAFTGATLSLGDGTYETTGSIGIAGTAIQNITPSTLYVTSGSVAGSYSQYDQEGYAAYATANAALFGNPRPYLPGDAGALLVTLSGLAEASGKLLPAQGPGFSFAGTALTAPAAGGYSADLVVAPGSSTGIDILGPGGTPQKGDVGILASTIDAVGAPAVFLGNSFAVPSDSVSTPNTENTAAADVTIAAGATLSAGAIFILATNRIDVDAGAEISTLGKTAVLPDSSTGVLFSPGPDAVLAAANGTYAFPTGATGTATINLGVCEAASTCGASAKLLSSGFLGFFAGGATTIAPTVVFGASSLELDTSTLSIGSPPAGTPPIRGADLTQATLNQLIAGDPAAGLPGLQTLQLIAGTSIDLFGNATLTTLNAATGTSTLGTLVITTPALYGAGSASQTASITTGTLVWTGLSSTGSVAPQAGAPGTGTGTLDVTAQEIVIGYPAQSQAQNETTLQHTILGFADVDLTATQAFTANNHAALSVYASASTSGTIGTTYAGGDLTIATPMLTTAPGAILGLTAGGTLSLLPHAGSAASAGGLGGEIDIVAAAVNDGTDIALPSGKLAMDATGNITLLSGASIDLAGPIITIIDQQRGSFGGTADLLSQTGNITEAAGAGIDISAAAANAGTLNATAREGSVTLLGALSAGAASGFDAGSVGITATNLATITDASTGTATIIAGDFAQLNALLDTAGADYSRSFEQIAPQNLPDTFRTVALSVGNVTAQNVNIDVDGGSLAVTGTIDASGSAPGSISLAATGNLTLAGSAKLEAQETALHTDSFGQIIAAENTPHIELQVASNTKTHGTLTIASGATIDMAGPDGLALGDLELDVARTDDDRNANIEATGNITITGAAAINVNAFTTYVAGKTSIGGTIVVPKDGTITEATLDAINTQSQGFIDASVYNGALKGPLAQKLSGLSADDAGVLNLRPGVEIDSGASGDLTVSGALNLANFRYASSNPTIAQPGTAAYGSGQPGVLWLRAENTLTIAGDITDGFAAPPSTSIDGHPLNHLWALSPMLAAGDLSWSMRLVAGADLAAADSNSVLGGTISGAPATSGGGDLILSNLHALPNNGNNFGLNIDVIRTGTGYIDLYAGGNFTEKSPFGIYTAGTQLAAAPNAPGANYASGGGNVTLVADGNAQGYVAPLDTNGQTEYQAVAYTNNVLNWLQHDKSAWWIDFGRIRGELLFAPSGLATFGGGNIDVTVGGDAGNIATINGTLNNPTGGGLDITVATTGYVDPATGAVVVSGGGDISLNVGGALNPAGPTAFYQPSDNLYGAITDLRGQVSITAGSVGQIGLLYEAISNDPRPVNPYVSETFEAEGGPTLILGDAAAQIDTRGDLVLGGVGNGGGLTFSLYQPTTAVRLYAAGGNLVPTTTTFDVASADSDSTTGTAAIGQFYYYPPILDVVAASGSIYAQGDNADQNFGLELAPSPDGKLDFLAGQSIYDGSPADVTYLPVSIEMSGAATLPASELPGMLFPVQFYQPSKTSDTTDVYETASGTLHAGDPDASLFYAASGDVVGLKSGVVCNSACGGTSATVQYIGATAVQIIAGGDVVATGGASAPYLLNGVLAPGGSPDFFLDNNATDISLIEAGKDVIYANADVAGPGLLEVQAGNNVYQGDHGILLSLGDIGAALTPLTRDAGAGITVLAGTDGGFNTTAFADLYLNPADLANAGTPLQDQPGKVERTYQDQLYAWLTARGYTGTEAGALAYFLTLPQFEQSSFLLTVYYAELNQSGLDYNNPQSRFYHSYLEGQEAISSLFPATDASGKAPADGGSLTLFSGAGTAGGTFNTYDSAIRTEYGGAITTVVPYGETLLGNYGIVPQATAGILTQGSGNIDMYSYGSVILGQSRVLTTLGGNVLIWMSSDGEINAGRGSKTTALTPPPNISYDIYGNVFLSPTVPSSGAGIGALAPIAGIPAGDVNLIAPVGSIDAGEAGVRASGNINVAALTVVNGANLQSGGKTSGVPTVTGPSAASVAAASSTSGQSQSAGQSLQSQRVAPPQPSIIEVEVLVGGSEDDADEKRKRKRGGA